MSPPSPLNRSPSRDEEKAETGSSYSSQDRSNKAAATTNSDAAFADSSDGALVTEKSRGVVQMEALQSRLSTKYRILLYGGFALLAYVMSLDQYTNGTYLQAATSVSFAAHSTLTTISSIKSVFQAVSQPPIAMISNTFGRLEAYSVCLFLYALGYIVVASAQSVYAYAAGSSINVLGITGLFLLQNIIISDISSTRNRVMWSIFPSIPGTINVWVSGNITQSFLGASYANGTKWRWGIGMFTILVPVLATPIMLTLGIGMRQTKAQAQAKLARPAGGDQRTLWQKTVSAFWQLDVIGLLLFVAGWGMLLVIITIANGKGSHWSDAHCIALLTVGGILVFAFVAWEKFGARHPLIPFDLIRNRTVLVCFFIALLHPCAGGVIGSYFRTYLQVAQDQTTLSATRIGNITGFTSTLTAFCVGVAIRYIRYLKPVILCGFCIEVLAFGLMIRYRTANASLGDLIAVQIVRGLGSGAISFPVQAAIQSVTKHEHLAAITAGYLTVFYLAQGVGSAIGGGIWSNMVPQRMNNYIANQTLAAQAYANPLGLLATYAPGTEVRDAMSRAQGETQVPCFLQTVRLTDEQSLEQVEKAEDGKLKLDAN
ncbi:hypothetical protein Rhopal_004585-T1 [Rhodotorula paludigena]|uniref:Uncharacterized protein n=1 Tax=Rhodotorula paludigena TaxID=86838 RepID=A0AAV5GPZ3_9BASI|nr:hypothetical protein Rhopal_004585-T1 [Rhodotorula paludigena]